MESSGWAPGAAETDANRANRANRTLQLVTVLGPSVNAEVIWAGPVETARDDV
jgi:hypothetical protein